MKRWDFMLLVAWLAISAALAWTAFSLGGVDFGVYYGAARVTLEGGNPYDYGELMGQIVNATGKLNNPYYYAPWFTWSLLPLAWLSYEAARAVWAAINVLLWFLGLFNLDKLIDWPPTGWKRWGMYTIVTFLFAWSTWGFEQVGVLIFALISMALMAVKRQRWTEIGIWLALLLFKPNITVLPVLAISAWLLRHRHFKPVLVLAIAVAGMVLISLVITPGWYRALIQNDKLEGLSYTLNSQGGTELLRHNTTLMDFLAVYHVTAIPATLIYAVVVLLGLAAIFLVNSRPGSIMEVTAVALLVNFAITPYALFYDYPTLVLTLFHANAVPLHSRPAIWLRNALDVFVAASLFIGDNISYRYWMLIPLGLLLAMSHALERPEITPAWIPAAH